MSYEHKDNSGTLFKNDRKEGNQPDYRGECKVDGKLWQMAAWIKDGKNGKFMSFSFSVPYEKAGQQRREEPPDEDFNDDIPFAWVLTAIPALGLIGEVFSAGQAVL